MKTRQVWTPYRDDILRKRYPKEGASEALCGFLGESKLTLMERARRISILGPRRWSKEQINLLLKRYPSEGPSLSLSKAIGRSPNSVSQKASLLKIEMTRFEWNSEKIKLFREEYPKQGNSPELRGLMGCVSTHTLHNKAKELKIRAMTTKVGNKGHRWKGFGNVPGAHLSHVKAHATTRRLDFEITCEDVHNQITAQNNICSMTGIPISFTDKTASVDRIDSARGYTPDNIQITHKNVNVMRWKMTIPEFRHWCSLVVKHLPAPTPTPTEWDGQGCS